MRTSKKGGRAGSWGRPTAGSGAPALVTAPPAAVRRYEASASASRSVRSQLLRGLGCVALVVRVIGAPAGRDRPARARPARRPQARPLARDGLGGAQRPARIADAQRWPRAGVGALSAPRLGPRPQPPPAAVHGGAEGAAQVEPLVDEH